MTPLLVWEVAGRKVGVERRLVRAVEVGPAVSPVPWAPPWLAGLIPRDGRAVPVVDVGALRGSPPLAAVGAVVVVIAEGHEVGLAAAARPKERRASEAAADGVVRLDPDTLGAELGALARP